MDDMKRGRTAPKPEKRPNRLTRILTFLVTVALVLGAVALIANYDKLNFDAIKRWFAYRSLERNESGQAEAFPVYHDTSSAFAALGNDLLVCSGTDIRLYSSSGQLYIDQAVSMENPVASAVGDTAYVYDAGGRYLFVYREREEVFSLTLEEDLRILSAEVNQNGWLTVVSQESGYKGAVTIYDSSFAPQIRIRLSSRFIMDAALSPDNASVALLTAGLSDQLFNSQVEMYSLDRPADEIQPDWAYSLGSTTILELCWNSTGIWCLGESSLSILNADGSLSGLCDYTGLYLKGFSLDGDGMAALLLGKFRAGSSAELWVADPSGQIRASLPMEEQVLSLSAAGRYVSVLTADRLDIYDQDLSLYHTLNGTQGVQKLLQRSDGSAILIDSSTARVYIPQ